MVLKLKQMVFLLLKELLGSLDFAKKLGALCEKDKIIELIKKISPADQRFLSQLKVIIENHLRKGKR